MVEQTGLYKSFIQIPKSTTHLSLSVQHDIMLLNNGLKNPCDVFDKINIKYLLMEQMHHRRLQIECSGNWFCGYLCIVCRIFPTTFCILYTYLSLKTKNAEILVYHSKKKKNQYIFLIYVYSFTQIN